LINGQVLSGTQDCDGFTGHAIESPELSPSMKNVETVVFTLYHSFYSCHGQTIVFGRAYLKIKGFSGIDFQNEKLMDMINLEKTIAQITASSS
jgi:hypothetical protein